MAGVELLIVGCLGLASDVLVVDDDGGGPFTSIQDAIVAAAPGDVLLVQPGTYTPFTLGKSLSILGPASGALPQVEGASSVSKAGPVTLAGLGFDVLRIRDDADRVVVDECVVGVPGDFDAPAAIEIVACDQALVSRCKVRGSNTTQVGSYSGTAVRAVGSHVAIVDCELKGGTGEHYPGGLGNPGNNGGPALDALNCTVEISGSQLAGGAEGIGGGGFSPQNGQSGDGLRGTDSAFIVRGAATDWVKWGGYTPSEGGAAGYSVNLHSSTLVVSGVQLDESWKLLADGSVILHPPVTEPWLEIGGDDGPGQTRTITVSGPQGATALVLAGLEAELTLLPKLESPLWMRLGGALAPLPIVTSGALAPVMLQLPLPASFAGLEGTVLTVQAVFPTVGSTLVPGTCITTAPSDVVVRF